MIRKTCYSCKSTSVNVLKSCNGWKTIHQFCAHCGKDQTKHVLSKRRNTRKSQNLAPRKRRTRHSNVFAYSMLGWAICAVLSLPFIPWTVTYAADVNKVPQFVSIAKIIDTKAEVRPESIHDKITRYSAKYGIKREAMRVLVGCETSWTFDPKIQSSARYKDGTREKSFGLSQLHAPAHPEISYDEMTNADFSLDWMGSHWKQRHDLWVTCTALHKI